MNAKLLALIREEFIKELSSKTGWGRNEIIQAYDLACSRATVKFIDEMQKH